ncbi:hypothetical protein Celaphus_00018261, partial [Cervus elaphus hippelaphus]
LKHLDPGLLMAWREPQRSALEPSGPPGKMSLPTRIYGKYSPEASVSRVQVSELCQGRLGRHQYALPCQDPIALITWIGDFLGPSPVSWMVQAGIRTETQIHGASLSKNTPGLKRSSLQWSCSRSRPPEWLRIQQHSSHPIWTT